MGPTERAEDWFRDPGVQNERTSLAWQRTALSIAAGSAVLARVTVGAIGVWALIVLGLSLLMSGLTYVSLRWEYHRRARLADPPAHVREGARAALLAGNVLLLCVTELVALQVS